MITLLFTLAFLAFAGEITTCKNVAGTYTIADGRGRPVGENVFAKIEQTDCSVTVAFQAEKHEGVIERNSIQSLDGLYTGNVDDEGRILWSNGFYYIPDFMEMGELFPVDCLHPFSLYCHNECSECVPCATGEPADIDCGSQCGHCEMCLDYVPCLEPIADMPECVEPEAFDCLRECRECAPCAEYDDCLEVTTAIDPICLEPRAGECMDSCAECVPCASGDSPFMDCSECARCEDCMPYVDCLDQVQNFPDDLRKCVSSQAITCFHECEDCSSCADKFYCLEAFEDFQPPVVDPPAEMCCKSMTADCLACSEGMSVDDYCRRFPETVGCGPTMCCEAMTADCLACSASMSIEDYCRIHPATDGCPTMCCMGMTADCLACSASMSIEDYCRMYPVTDGCNNPMPCHQDDAQFKAIVNSRPSDHSATWPDWVRWVNEQGCLALLDDNAARDWCHQIEGACDCICQRMPPSPEFEECREDKDCLYPGCEAYDFNEQRCENKGDYGICMVGDMTCPKRPEGSLKRGEPEMCTQHSDCSYSTCDIEGYSLPGHCSGADEASRDCENGECVCVHGNSDFRCEGKPNEFDLLDGGWCYDGRRDAHCPLNPERSSCIEMADGNYQLNDEKSGEVFLHMTIKQYGCQGEAKTSDNSYIRMEFFQNQILAIDGEGNFHRGVPEPTGTLLWNGHVRMTQIPCMFVHSGTYNIVNPDGHVEGMHQISQDGCNAVSKDNDGNEFRFELSERTISGTIFDGQFITGSLIEDSFVIQWDIGFQSHPLFEYEHPQCNEDGHRFGNYVRSVASNMDNPKIVDFVNRIDWEGCNVLRHDHDAKYDWCTFHPEARDACSCVCNEVNHPKPVCSHDQIDSWIHRDLSHECSELFVSGLAEEHRPACGCLKTIDESTAVELFGSDCYFTEWSDRSFMQMWRDCQWH